MDMCTKIENRADGSVACVVGSASEYITFARNRSGQVRWVARTTHLSRSQFTEALKLAIRKIAEAERQVWAEQALPGAAFAQTEQSVRQQQRRLVSKRQRRANAEELQKELDLFASDGEVSPQPEGTPYNITT